MIARLSDGRKVGRHIGDVEKTLALLVVQGMELRDPTSRKIRETLGIRLEALSGLG